MRIIQGRHSIKEAAAEMGVTEAVLHYYVETGWIEPADPGKGEWDEEDLSRARLIIELRQELGVNDEAVPIILDLLDQIHSLHRQIRKRWAA